MMKYLFLVGSLFLCSLTFSNESVIDVVYASSLDGEYSGRLLAAAPALPLPVLELTLLGGQTGYVPLSVLSATVNPLIDEDFLNYALLTGIHKTDQCDLTYAVPKFYEDDVVLFANHDGKNSNIFLTIDRNTAPIETYDYFVRSFSGKCESDEPRTSEVLLHFYEVTEELEDFDDVQFFITTEAP